MDYEKEYAASSDTACPIVHNINVETSVEKLFFGGVFMRVYPEDVNNRAVKAAKYIVEHKCTIRAAERALGIPRTVIHYDLCRVLPAVDLSLYDKVRDILEWNKSERHIRGGAATKEKYENAHKPS